MPENKPLLSPGAIVLIEHEEDCTIPAGEYVVSSVNSDGSFQIGGNTAIWPRRIVYIREATER